MSKRLRVNIQLSAVEVTEEGEQGYYDAGVTYHDLSYGGLVTVETALLGALKTLNEAGIQIAESRGEKVKELLT